ncbi:MAG: YcdB/YcdC domain-containing protein [Deltaproteobacteria bacterium]
MKTRIHSIVSLALTLILVTPVSVLGNQADLSVPAISNTKLLSNTATAMGTSATAPGAISLNQAIMLVKKNFTVPANLTEFNSGYEAHNDQTQVWRLEWRSKDQTQGNFMATVDILNGEILSMNRWENQVGPANRIPTVTLIQARQTGQNLINRLIPSKASSLVADENSSLVPINSYGQTRYTMRWHRVYKGIPVDNDSARVDIDMQSGEIISYDLNWNKVALPEPTGLITPAQAAQVFSNEKMLTLQYFAPGSIVPLTSSVLPPKGNEPKLVYAIHHTSNGAIDATTGKPFISPIDSFGFNDLRMQKLSMGESGGAVSNLSPEEQSEVDQTLTLISQEQAVQAVLKWFALPKDFTLQSANLERQYDEKKTRCWNLSWQRQSGKEGASYGYAWAQVDAANGELISFSLSDEDQAPDAACLNKEEARQLAEGFIKKIQAGRWPDLRLDESQRDSGNTSSSNWSFNYYRLVNNVPYFDNTVNITINASKEITYYRLEWSKAAFPPIQGLIDRTKANNIYLTAAPMKLRYVYTAADPGNQRAYLVYLPEAKDGFYMVDAKTGAGLNSNGVTPVPETKALHFNDIKGHYAEREISLLGQAGIMGEYGESFHPEEKITLRSLLTAMLGARDGVYNRSTPLTDEEIINRAIEQGWIKVRLDLNTQVNRELLAELMLRYLKIEYLTDVTGIYYVPYQDAKTMSAETYAIAALNWGLSIIRADGKNFDACHIVTRAEAAAALVHMLSIKVRQ